MPWRGVFIAGSVVHVFVVRSRTSTVLNTLVGLSPPMVTSRLPTIAAPRPPRGVGRRREVASTGSSPGRNARPRRGSCRPTAPDPHRVEVTAVRHARKVVTRRRHRRDIGPTRPVEHLGLRHQLMVRLPARHDDLVAHNRRRARRTRMMHRRQLDPRAVAQREHAIRHDRIQRRPARHPAAHHDHVPAVHDRHHVMQRATADSDPTPTSRSSGHTPRPCSSPPHSSAHQRSTPPPATPSPPPADAPSAHSATPATPTPSATPG